MECRSIKEHNLRLEEMLKRKQGTAKLREDWTAKLRSEQRNAYTPLSKSCHVHRSLVDTDNKMRSDHRSNLLLRSDDLHDFRVSERGHRFLRSRKACRDNLSTAKYYTGLNTRQKQEEDIIWDDKHFKSLTTRRLVIPQYQVPTNLPELSTLTSLVNTPTNQSSKSSQLMSRSESGTKMGLSDWMELVTRKVPDRPQFAEPIRCHTPNLSLSMPDFQKPRKAVFKQVDKRSAPRDYTVHPEFYSEVLSSQYIQGQSSNPLKYGWA